MILSVARNTGSKPPAQPRPDDVLWERLEILRSRKGDPSYETMAKGCGLPRSTLHYWFTKHVIPEWVPFVRLLKYFNQDPRRWKTLHTDARNNGRPSMRPGKGQAASQPVPKPPAQLLAGVSGFAGRGAELALLDKIIIDAVADEVAALRICVLSGTAGIGKTTLAIHWSRQLADRFPDGQLYVNLRGFEPAGLTRDPAEVIRDFLDAMQIPPGKIATDLDARAAQYRSLLAGRRMLIVLDNARDAEQVRPLLPAAPECLVVVTSRNQLTGLVATHGAQLLPLGPLPAGEARELLSRRLGRGHLDADPAATEQIIVSCAGLPLALAVVAARAAAHPGFSLRDLAAELSGPAVDLDALSGGDPATDVRTAFASSYRALTADAARLFRILGLHPGPDLTAPAAASLAGMPQRQVRPALAELSRTQLITEHTPGRYTLHDLLRAYANELATTTDSQQQRHAVTHRLLDHYLTTAHTAALLLNPHRPPITLAPHQPGVWPEDLRSHDEAMTWLSAEFPVLLTAVQFAARAGFDTHAWQLAWALSEFLDRRGLWHDWIASQLAALDATKRTFDQTAQARINRTLGIAYNSVGRPDDAHAHITQALTIYTRLGDPIGQAATHHSLARTCARGGDHQTALYHARHAADLYHAACHRGGQADALNALGWYHAQLRDYDQAIRHCEHALALHRQDGHLLGQAGTLDSLGYAHHHLNQHPDAIRHYQRAIDIYRDAGERYEQAATLARLGDTHHAAGNPTDAHTAWRLASDILDELGHSDAERVRAKLN